MLEEHPDIKIDKYIVFKSGNLLNPEMYHKITEYLFENKNCIDQWFQS